MTAEEIRKLRDESVGSRLTEDSREVFFLAEIAAQLAEMNSSRQGYPNSFQHALLEAGNRMARHYRELSKLMGNDGTPSISEWEKLTKAEE